MNIGDSSFERVDEVKYLGTTSKNQNYFQQDTRHIEVMDSLLSFVAEFLSSSWLFKILKIKI
jgi:hypothetical protein